jgi:DNA-binding HxlR family transcriptional regulator
MSQPDSSAAEGKAVAIDDAVPSEEELEDLRSILDQTRCIILQQILAHDSGVLSKAELEARNPDVNESTLQYHIDTLVERGILRKLDAPENKRDLPSVFYAVSERGIELLKQVNLYDEIAVWNQMYSQVPTPEGLKKIEDMERTEPDWYDDLN